MLQNILRTSNSSLLNLINKPQVWAIQHLRNCSKISSKSRIPSDLLHGNRRPPAYFSITRQKLGPSEAEVKMKNTIYEHPPIEIHHCRRDIQINMKKLRIVANLVTNMSIEEAITQSEFSVKGASSIVKEVLLEAQERAVNEFGIDGKLLWVKQSYVGRGVNLKRRVPRSRAHYGIMKEYYSHYFVILREGVPPLAKNIKRSARLEGELQTKLRHPKTIKWSLSWF